MGEGDRRAALDGTAEPVVAVCALTFRRPDGLRALLEGIGRLDRPAAHDVVVVIVDNDEAGAGEAVVRQLEDELPWPITYEIEPRRGIAQGRNRAVGIARRLGAGAVVFVDDDEVPDRRWLVELLAVRDATGADVVTGPVLPRFAEPPPAWVEQGRFFDRPRLPDGAPMHYARTSNVLIGAHVFPPDDAPFAEWFGLSGGDDTHFFLRAHLAGHRIVWADHAIVSEVVPSSRVDVGWLVKREYRRGNTLSLCLRDLQDSPWRRARRVAQALVRVAQGAVVLVSAAVRGRVAMVQGLQLIALGAGLLSGLAGVRYDEYRVVHGS